MKIINNSKKPRANNEGNCCPKLGISTDHSICYAYPTEKNICYQVQEPCSVIESYQSEFCLTPQYKTCQVYRDSNITQLPDDIKQASEKKGIRPLMLVLPIAILVSLSVSIYLILSSDRISIGGIVRFETETSTYPYPTQLLIAPASSTPKPTAGTIMNETIIPESTKTNTPSPTTLDTFTPGPEMMTPFGPDNRYLIHEVRGGESLVYIANLYNTSIDVLKKLNVIPEGLPLWVGDKLVVMPNQTDPADVIPLRIVRLEVKTKIIDLSLEYGVSEADLRWYNSLGADEWLPANRWLIIPRNP